MKIKEIAQFLQESVDYLVENQCGNCRYKLDDHLAIFVGWSAGYGDEKRYDVIQGTTNLDWGIDAGIKVWTSDDVWCDYECVNFPYYENGDVLDMAFAVSPQEDWERAAKYLLEMYEEVRNLDIDDNGLILDLKEVEDEMEIRYYVCGIGYDANGRITDYERYFGDFDTYEDAYEEFERLKKQLPCYFFEDAHDVIELCIQIEECEEGEDETTCVDVKNEWWIINPPF